LLAYSKWFCLHNTMVHMLPPCTRIWFKSMVQFLCQIEQKGARLSPGHKNLNRGFNTATLIRTHPPLSSPIF
jgi:hypothetical protein